MNNEILKDFISWRWKLLPCFTWTYLPFQISMYHCPYITILLSGYNRSLTKSVLLFTMTWNGAKKGDLKGTSKRSLTGPLTANLQYGASIAGVFILFPKIPRVSFTDNGTPYGEGTGPTILNLCKNCFHRWSPYTHTEIYSVVRLMCVRSLLAGRRTHTIKGQTKQTCWRTYSLAR